MNKDIKLPDFDNKTNEEILQPFTNRTQKNNEVKAEDPQFSKLKSYKIGANYYFTPTNFALKNANYLKK